MKKLKKLLIATAMLLPGVALAQVATVHKTPWCGCCDGYVKYLQSKGFETEYVNHQDMTPVHKEHGITRELASCHTTVVGPYAIEGHMPVEVINKLLAERPMVRGIALPGMPAGSPGMGGHKQEPYTVYFLASAGGEPRVFTTH